MILKELKFKSNPLCYCHRCNGTGLAYFLRMDLTVACHHCNGRGYETIHLYNDEKLFIDEEKGTIYQVRKGKIINMISLFDGLKVFNEGFKRFVVYDDIAYKKYRNESTHKLNKLLKSKTNHDDIISFDMFMKGYLPKPSCGNLLTREPFNPEVNQYEITENEIILKKLNLGKNYKHYCSNCHGTGVISYLVDFEYPSEDLGIVCDECNGLGYKVSELYDRFEVVADTTNNYTYLLDEGNICMGLELFQGRRETDQFKYVIYNSLADSITDKCLENAKDFINIGASKDELITYHKFLSGRLPLPMEKYVCPYYFTEGSFNNNCASKKKYGSILDCPDFENGRCWQLFYGDARTAGEKQEVLRRLRKK